MQRRRGIRPGVGGKGGFREQRGVGGQVRTVGPGQTEALISKQSSDKQGLGWGLREAPCVAQMVKSLPSTQEA